MFARHLTTVATTMGLGVALLVAHLCALDASRRPLTRAAASGETQPVFDLASPSDGPFPSDWFTVADHTNLTHRRVALPFPDCTVNVTDCKDIEVLNSLDGFNDRPRLSIPFTGPIDPATVTSDSVFLLSLGSTAPGEGDMPAGTAIGIDQVVWDPDTNRLHVQSDALLAQHTRFALIVTRRIRDQNGVSIQASDAFHRFRATVRGDYKDALIEAIQAARDAGVREDDVAVASVFTTQSVTAVLEKMRDQIHGATPAPADFLLGPNGERTVFDLAAVTSIAWTQAPGTPATAVSLSLVRGTFPGAVGVLAFGRYRSPDYLEHPQQYMAPVATRTGTPVVHGTSDIYFNLFLPAGPRPSGGWPVAIFGHGINNSKNGVVLNVAATMAHYGLATVAINAVGHGLSPLGTLTVSPANVTFPAGGRGVDQDGNGAIGTSEGVGTTGDRAILFTADTFRQTAADLVQLVRVLGVGMDVDGDGTPDLDASRVYYFGSSYGAAYGIVFLAVEPAVRVGVLAVPADTIPIGPLGIYRPTVVSMLGGRQPSLLNAPGITDLGGLVFGAPTFDENVPLRNREPLVVGFADKSTRLIQSPVTNTVPGAMAIQECADRFLWAGEAGSPAAYAPHLRKAPLADVSAKSVLLLLAKGDQSAPNPTTTAIVRAGDLADRTLWYRHDSYWSSCGTALLPVPNPHGLATALSDKFLGPVSLAAQKTAGDFLASDGGPVTVIQPGPFAPGCTPPPLFEFPIPQPLPEVLNYRW